MSDIDQYVTAGRCLCCGSRKLQWSPAQIVAACQTWTREHGRTPASMHWANATPEYPSRTTVLYVFGKWNNMLKAAGLFGRENGGHNWSKDDIANAMLDILVMTGSWPSWHSWHTADPDGRRPTSKTVVKLFGSWNNAKRYAGWDGTDTRTKTAHIEASCSGCGRTLDEDFTIGCKICANRKHTRAKRAAKKSGVSLRVVESPLTPADSDASADGENSPGRPVTQAAAAA